MFAITYWIHPENNSAACEMHGGLLAVTRRFTSREEALGFAKAEAAADLCIVRTQVGVIAWSITHASPSALK